MSSHEPLTASALAFPTRDITKIRPKKNKCVTRYTWLFKLGLKIILCYLKFVHVNDRETIIVNREIPWKYIKIVGSKAERQAQSGIRI